MPPKPVAPAPTEGNASAAATTATPKPEIANVRLALDIDPKTMKLRGTGSIFTLAQLNQAKKLRVAVLLKSLRGGETLTMTLIDPSGKESPPVVQQYGPDDHGDFFAAAFFEANPWKPGPHQLKVNLSDQAYAISEFIVAP